MPGMYGRMAVVGVVAAVIGGVGGIAAMSPYVQAPATPGAPEPTRESDPGIVAELPVPGADGAARAVGDRITSPACRALNLDGHAAGVPGLAQVSKVGVVVVDAAGQIVGHGECAVQRPGSPG